MLLKITNLKTYMTGLLWFEQDGEVCRKKKYNHNEDIFSQEGGEKNPDLDSEQDCWYQEEKPAHNLKRCKIK